MMSGCLYQYSDNLEEEEMAEKMTVAILGLGSRGLQVYAPIIEQNAEKMELTAVADLMEEKVEEAKTRYHLKAENCFYSAEELLSADRLADVMFICTQDRDHVKHAVEAIKKDIIFCWKNQSLLMRRNVAYYWRQQGNINEKYVSVMCFAIHRFIVRSKKCCWTVQLERS